MPKLIIIRGNSGSGKTTVAKALQRKFGPNTLLLSQDVVRRNMLMARDGADNTALPLLVELLALWPSKLCCHHSGGHFERRMVSAVV